MQTKQLISELTETTRSHIRKAEHFKSLSDAQLNRRPGNEAWNILECLEHLNLYGDFYIPEMAKAIRSSKSHPSANYKSGWLGNYFANSMLPGEKLNKMKTFRDKNTLNRVLDAGVIDRFIHQQQELLMLLESARRINLEKLRIKTSISSLLRLKLGDTFRFVINHNVRHMAQAEKLL